MRLFGLIMASKSSVPPNNIRTDADEKQQTASFPIVNFDVPQVGVFDAPLRYYPVNKEWAKIITGALDLYAQVYAWQGAEDELDVRIQAVLEIRKGFDLIIASCDDVENCIQTSPTVLTIESDVASNASSTNANSSNITDLQNTTQDLAQSDGNVYPAYPTYDLQPDGACGSAYYVVQKVRDFIAGMEDATNVYPDLISAIEGYLDGVLNMVFSPVNDLLSQIFSGVPPTSVLTDFDSQAAQMRDFLYCNGFDKSAFENEVRTNYTSGSAIADFISCIGLGSWNSWVAIGSQDASQDCSSFNCFGLWCHFFDFSINDGGWSTNAEYSRDFGFWNGSAWESVFAAVGGDYDQRLYIDWTYDNAADTVDVEVDLEVTGLIGGAARCTVFAYIGGASYSYQQDISIGRQVYTYNVQRPGMTKIRVIVLGAKSTDVCTFYVHSVKLSGNHTVNASNEGDNC